MYNPDYDVPTFYLRKSKKEWRKQIDAVYLDICIHSSVKIELWMNSPIPIKTKCQDIKAKVTQWFFSFM